MPEGEPASFPLFTKGKNSFRTVVGQAAGDTQTKSVFAKRVFC